ncbi:MAG: hypothetical protein WC119_01170 [Synergistaceae bacterium]
MRVTIKGITPSTIAFNTLGIVIRGDSKNLKLYPESYAKHIDIVNEAQLAEVNSLVNARLITIEVEDAPKPKPNPVSPDRLAAIVSPEPVQENESAKTLPKTDTEEEEVEDAPRKGRGRPKGSKNKNSPKSSKITSVKKVKKASAEMERKDDPESRSIVMTPNGAVEGRVTRSVVGDIPDGDRTQASLDALKKLEEEEELDGSLPDIEIDESTLDPSERMGMEAVISAGENGAEKVEMKNSIIPEASQIRERGVEFIDQADKDADEKARKLSISKKAKTDDDDEFDFLEC